MENWWINFISNIKNNNKLNNLYYSTIVTWTQYDPLKRKIAKENNLKYIEFWNLQEVQNWLDNYEKT